MLLCMFNLTFDSSMLLQMLLSETWFSDIFDQLKDLSDCVGCGSECRLRPLTTDDEVGNPKEVGGAGGCGAAGGAGGGGGNDTF